MENLEPSEYNEGGTTRRMSSVSNSSSTGEDDIVDKTENEGIRTRRKRFVKRFNFQDIKTKPKKKEDNHKEETMGSVSDGEGELKSRKRMGVMEKIRRFGSRDNLDDISKEEKENKKQEKRRGRKTKEEKVEDSHVKRKRSKSREGALAFFDRFKGVHDDSSSDEEEFAEDFLKEANRCRKNHGLESFAPSKELNTLAHDCARSLAKEQNIKDRKAQKYGRNIYKKQLKNEEEKVKAENVIHSWYQEINNFKFGQNPLDPDLTKNATQLLWKDSRVIGVGKAKSSSKNIVFVAAYFSPRGNVIGQFPENVPPLGGFSPRLSKSDKHRESSTSDEDEKPNIQESSIEKAKESEKGKIGFFTHMFDKLRKTNESGSDVSRKKDKTEPHGYIGNRQGKYCVNQERSPTSLSHGNIYIASNKELEEAKNNLRNKTGESKSSLELDSILIRSKDFEDVEKLQKADVKDDNISNSSSDEEEHHKSVKRNNSFSNKNVLEIDQSSNTLHDHSTLTTENQVEKCSYNPEDKVKIDLKSRERNSLEELKPQFNHVPQEETVVFESKVKLKHSETVTLSSKNLESDSLPNENEQQIMQNMKNSSVESSDSDSDSENKVCRESPEKPGFFSQVKTKVARLTQRSISNSEDSSEDENKFQNKVNINKSIDDSFINSKPLSSEKSEISYPVIQKENKPSYDSSFKFNNKEREDSEFFCTNPSDSEAIVPQAETTKEVLSRNSKHSSRESRSSSSSSEEDTTVRSSDQKYFKKNDIKENYDEQIIPSNNKEQMESIYNRYPSINDEEKLETFEPLVEKQKSINEGIKTEMLKEDSSSEEEEEVQGHSSSSEEEKVVMRIESDKKLVTIERERENIFYNEMEKELKSPDLNPEINNVVHSKINYLQEDSHIDKKYHNEMILSESRSESIKNQEVKKHDSEERLQNLSSSENEEQRNPDTNNELQRAFFNVVKVELFNKHESRNLNHEVDNSEVTRKQNENELSAVHLNNTADKSLHQSKETNKRVLDEERSSSSDSDAEDNERNYLKQKDKSNFITVPEISQNISHEDNEEEECTKEDIDFKINNILRNFSHEENLQSNSTIANQSETMSRDSNMSEVKSSAETQQSSSDSDTLKKSSKPPVRRRSFKNILQGISGKKSKENLRTDVNQNKTSDSSDVASGNESSSSKSSIKIENKRMQATSVNDNPQLEIHLNSSDSEGNDGKKRKRKKSFKNLFLDLAQIRKHDQNDSKSDENIETPNSLKSTKTPTSSQILTSTTSISSKNSETESSDVDCNDQKHSNSMKKRRKSFKDIFQDLKLTISRDNVESDKSGTTSPASTISPTTDKDENKTPDKHRNESYISRIKHIFESSENLLQKSDKSEKQETKVTHEDEDFNKQENFIQVLEAINKIRKKHNAGSLILSEELCEIAIERAENLASGIAGHLQNDIGENIFIYGASGTTIKDVLDLAVQNWYKTISFHKFGVEEYNMKAGSFTQLVWRSSSKLGVGIYKSHNEVPSRITIVALFSPAGNIKGGFVEEVYPRIHSSESESDDESSTKLFDSHKKMVCNESKQI